MPVPGTFAPPSQGVDPAPEARGKVVFDGAHGVGAPKLSLLAPSMAALVHMEVRNGVEGPGELNDGVGAEHVQKTRTPPAGVDSVGTRWHLTRERWARPSVLPFLCPSITFCLNLSLEITLSLYITQSLSLSHYPSHSIKLLFATFLNHIPSGCPCSVRYLLVSAWT